MHCMVLIKVTQGYQAKEFLQFDHFFLTHSMSTKSIYKQQKCISGNLATGKLQAGVSAQSLSWADTKELITLHHTDH